MTKRRALSRKRKGQQEAITRHLPKRKRGSAGNEGKENGRLHQITAPAEHRQPFSNRTNLHIYEPPPDLSSTGQTPSISHTCPVQSSCTSQSGSCVVAPQIYNCSINGPVNVNVSHNCYVSGDKTRNAAVFDKEHYGAEMWPSSVSDAAPLDNCGKAEEVDIGLQNQLKCQLKERYMNIFEGIPMQGNSTHLNNIYTELYITEGEREGVNDEHEVWQIESASSARTSSDTPINCNDIFKPLPGEEKIIRTVLTKGIAGIGKTVSVQKFILDWAEGKANQDIDFIFVLPFGELNLITDKKYSLTGVFKEFHNDIENIEMIKVDKCKIVLILDGLDECQLSLSFRKRRLSGVTESSSVDVLLTNLINKTLLQSAFLWITTRPAAADQIPPEYVDRLTEIRGFNDSQKENYFKNKFSDQKLARRIISHIQSSRSLHIMCHIPVFCWISAVVLEKMLARQDNKEVPKTLTGMYSQFLLIQTSLKNKKYYGTNEMDLSKFSEEDKAIIVKLGELAFQQLLKHNIMFYKEDLEACGIDVTDAFIRSGVCTAVFKRFPFSQKKVYCFVHLTVQEFLAAFYAFHLFSTKKIDALRNFFKVKSYALHDLHKAAVDKALKSKNGHLDLFLRFLFGISLDSNKRILQGLLPPTRSNPVSINIIIKYVKVLRRKELSPERCINLIHCLVELGHNSIVDEMQNSLISGMNKRLTPAQSSALAYVLITSEKALGEFDVRKYKVSQEGLRRLIPVMKFCRKV